MNKPRVKKRTSSMISVLRKLRGVLTGDVKKVGKYSYSVNGKVDIELNYFCEYGSKERRCLPHTISVRILNSYRHPKFHHRSPTTSVFSTRTIQKRADDSYNFDSVSTAITKCLEAIKAWELSVEENAKQETALKNAKKKAIEKLGKSLPKKGRKNNYSGFSWSDPEIRIHVSMGSDLIPEYSFDCETSSLSTIKKMMSAAK